MEATRLQIVTSDSELPSASSPGLINSFSIMSSKATTKGYILLWRDKASSDAFGKGLQDVQVRDFDVYQPTTDVCWKTTGRSLDEAKEIFVANASYADHAHTDKRVASDYAPWTGKPFGKIPGVVLKIFIANKETNRYGGVYFFDSVETRDDYANGNVGAKPIPCLGPCLQVSPVTMIPKLAKSGTLKSDFTFESFTLVK